MNQPGTESAISYPSSPVLIVDDQLGAVSGCEYALQSGGIINTLACQDSREVLPLMARQDISAVLLDLSMPHISGEELLPEIVRLHPDVPIIVVTAANEVDTAVNCMRAGAFDYMVKPVEQSRMISGVQRALELRELRQEYDSFRKRVLTNELEHPEAFAAIVTQSSQMRSLFQYVETVARTQRPILVTGETGVGKELFARAFHASSLRPGHFVAVNIAGLDDGVFSDTLFGHVRGAFTGAETARAGLIEQASGGTLFLDEISELNHASQVKLLRLLQEREYFPIGADAPKESDARIVCATNADLAALQHEGAFRPDLYYRLRTHHVHVPALRERPDDIPVLVDHFLERAARIQGKGKPTAPPELIALLRGYAFPGNVRELESMVFDAVSRHKSRMLSLDVFRERIAPLQGTYRPGDSRIANDTEPDGLAFESCLRLPTLKDASRLLIREALRRTGGNRTAAALLLGITRSGLSKAVRRAGIESDE